MNTALKFSDKQQARKYFASKRLEISETDGIELSSSICRHISKLPQFASCHTLLLYYPIKNEINLLPLARLAFDLGKQVAFPISIVETYTLDFRCVGSLDELRIGSYGICEPSITSSQAVLDSNTLCIVPALAYDIQGYRLGYGKGYYDRFLCSFKGTSVGVASGDFVCHSLPINETDVAVDIIITETGVIRNK